MSSHSFQYIDCDVPEGMTLSEYRHAKTQPARRKYIRGYCRRVVSLFL